MSTSTDFELMPGMFALCSGAWDESSQTFRQTTASEKMWCCLNTCKPQAQACLDRCERKYGPNGETPDFHTYLRCRESCSDIIIACENACSLSSPENIWRANSPLIKCIEEHKCGKYPNYDSDCIKLKENELLQCCRKDCMPTSTLSCDTHCKLKYADLVNKSQDPLIKSYNATASIRPHLYKEIPTPSDNSWIYYVSASLIVLLGVMLYLWWNKE